METTQLKISGMNCGACVNHVTEALQNVVGVQSAKIDLQSGTATVQHDENATAEAMVAAVSEEGYGAQLGGQAG